MGVFILLILFVGIVVILGKAGSSGKSRYHGGYARAYDYEDYDEYSDSEIRAAMYIPGPRYQTYGNRRNYRKRR